MTSRGAVEKPTENTKKKKKSTQKRSVKEEQSINKQMGPITKW